MCAKHVVQPRASCLTSTSHVVGIKQNTYCTISVMSNLANAYSNSSVCGTSFFSAKALEHGISIGLMVSNH